MRALLTWMALVLIPIAALPKSAIRALEGRIQKSREEISDLRSSAKALADLRRDLETELKKHEESFEAKFNKIVLPLLSWPVISLNSQKSSWAERQEGAGILDEVRARLVSEPLKLMADRELNLRTAIQLQNEHQLKMAALEKKEGLLRLQLEELKSLQKKTKSSRL